MLQWVPQKNAANCSGKVEAESTFEEMQPNVMLWWPITYTGDQEDMLFSMDKYYRANTRYIYLE